MVNLYKKIRVLFPYPLAHITVFYFPKTFLVVVVITSKVEVVFGMISVLTQRFVILPLEPSLAAYPDGSRLDCRSMLDDVLFRRLL